MKATLEIIGLVCVGSLAWFLAMCWKDLRMEDQGKTNHLHPPGDREGG